MVDLSEKVSDSEEMSSKNQEGGASSEEGQVKKTCADCGTSKTPLWRGGPAGPKSLCNACGIKSRKMRRAILGINKSDDHHNKKQQPKKRATTTTTTTTNQRSLDQKKRLLSIGKDVLMSRSRMEKQWRKLGEDEQAAVLLMALSYGSIYA